MIDSISKFAQLLLAAVAAIAIPFVVIQVFNTLRVLAAESKDRLTAQQLALVEGGLQIFIVAMRQSGLLDNILKAGESGLHDLAKTAESWLSDRGLPGIDLDFLVDLVKHELTKQGIEFPALIDEPTEMRSREFGLSVPLGNAFR